MQIFIHLTKREIHPFVCMNFTIEGKKETRLALFFPFVMIKVLPMRLFCAARQFLNPVHFDGRFPILIDPDPAHPAIIAGA